MKPLAELIGESPAIVAVREQIGRLLARQGDARRLSSILIQGETGTGKGLLARAIHHMSPRATRPFVDVNCPAIPETLLEAELFGFERGAFTDARQSKAGLFQVAHRGTIFLDEVGLLPEALQRKLLTVVEDRTVRRLGSTQNEPVDVWILAASNEDLEQATRAGRFRGDLYHRLAVLNVSLPPLRERGRDIVLLAEHFLARACADHDVPQKVLAADARAALQAYRWPGNVRELANMMERVALLTEDSQVTAAKLELPAATPEGQHEAGPQGETAFLEDVVRDHLLDVLHRTNWNTSRSAALLGISRNTLRHRIEKYGLRAEPASGAPRQRAQPPPAAAPAASPAAPVPAEVRASARMRWERRHVTLLRATLLAAPGTPGAADTSRALELLTEKVQTFGGRLEGLSPTGITGVFGIEPVEDAPQHAGHAAMAILTALERAWWSGAPLLTIKIGIHVSQFLLAKTSRGTTLDMDAAREAWGVLEALLESAEPNSVLVSDAAAPFLERRFELLSVRTGDRSQGQGYAVLRRERAGVGLGGRATTFVGRREELELLRSQFASVRRGHGQVVGITGEVGIGKSRLVFEFVRSLKGEEITYLEGRCHSYGGAVPFLPVLQILQDYCGLLEIDTPEIAAQKIRLSLEDLAIDPEEAAPYLLQLLGIKEDVDRLGSLSPSAFQSRTFDILRMMALKISRRRPLIMAVEDLHWIDATSEAYFTSLANSLVGASILLVCTYHFAHRPPWLEKSYATQVALQPLSPEDSLGVVRCVLGTDVVADSLVGLILAKAEGNPLFLEELTRAIREQDARPSSLVVPDTIENVLQARINRLPEEAKSLLQAGSVLGREVSSLLLRMTWDGSGDFDRCLQELTRLEFLYKRTAVVEPAYFFKHPLMQEVAYTSVASPRLQALHTAAGRALEALYADRLDQVYDRLAYHYSKTDQSSKAVEYLTRLGEKAARVYSHAEAADAFQQALAHVERLPASSERERLFVDLALCHAHSVDFLGRLHEVLDSLLRHRTRIEQLRDASLVGPYHFWLGRIYTVLGDHEETVRSAQEALEEARRCGDDAVMGKALYLLSYEEFWSGHPSRGVEYGRQAVAHLERTDDRWWTAVAHWVEAINYGAIGQFDLALASAARYHEMAEALRDSRLQSCAATAIGTFRALQGEWGEGIDACRQGVDLAPNASIATVATASLGAAYVELGDAPQAIHHLERSVGQFGDVSVSRNGGWFATLLSEAYLLNGDLEKARDLAAAALRATTNTKYWYGAGYAQRILGRIAHARGALGEAEAYLVDALQTFGSIEARFEAGRTHLALASLARDQGNRETAAKHLGEALELFGALSLPKYVERTERLARE